MFRLNDAVRRYRAQYRSQTKLWCVAAAATTLSPRANSDAVGVVASVAAVAAPAPEPIDLTRLIKQLQEEGVLLQHSENSLLIRPTHWRQMDRIHPYWKALLIILQSNNYGEEDEASRSA